MNETFTYKYRLEREEILERILEKKKNLWKLKGRYYPPVEGFRHEASSGKIGYVKVGMAWNENGHRMREIADMIFNGRKDPRRRVRGTMKKATVGYRCGWKLRLKSENIAPQPFSFALFFPLPSRIFPISPSHKFNTTWTRNNLSVDNKYIFDCRDQGIYRKSKYVRMLNLEREELSFPFIEVKIERTDWNTIGEKGIK